MSDLQCPATIILLTPATAAVSDMREHRLSLLLSERALQSAAVDCDCERTELELADGSALVTSIAQLADMYRGEQVAILARAQVICQALRLEAPPTAAIVLAVDSDGWQLLSR